MKGDRKERNKRAQSERGKEGERGGDYLIYNFFYQNAIPSIYSGFFQASKRKPFKQILTTKKLINRRLRTPYQN